MTPTPTGHSMPRSPRPRSTTSLPPQAMPIEAGATYVFDLGYYDYGWWAKMDAAGCRIVTRFKANTPLTVTAERDVPKDGNILSDRIGLLPQRQAAKTPSVIPFAKCG